MFRVNGWGLHPSAIFKAFSSISNHFWTTQSDCDLQRSMFERFTEAFFSAWVLYLNEKNYSEIYFLKILSTDFQKHSYLYIFENPRCFIFFIIQMTSTRLK